MPAKSTTPAVPAPKFVPTHYTAADIAEIKGVTPEAIHRDLGRGRRGVTGTGAVVPVPDPVSERPYPFARILTWAADREDVLAFLGDPSVVPWR